MKELDKDISKKYRISKFLRETVLIYFILFLGSLIMIAPFVWMISTSLKEPGAVFTFPPEFIPRTQIMANYNNMEYGLFNVPINGKEEKVIKLKVFKDEAEVMLYKDGKIIEEVLTVHAPDLKPYKKETVVRREEGFSIVRAGAGAKILFVDDR